MTRLRHRLQHFHAHFIRARLSGKEFSAFTVVNDENCYVEEATFYKEMADYYVGDKLPSYSAGTTIDLLISNSNASNDIAIYTNIALLIVLYSVGFLFQLPPKKTMGIIGEKVSYNLRMELFDKMML